MIKDSSIVDLLDQLQKRYLLRSCLILGQTNYSSDFLKYFSDISIIATGNFFKLKNPSIKVYPNQDLVKFTEKNNQHFDFVYLGESSLSADDTRRIFVELVRSDANFVLVSDKVTTTKTSRQHLNLAKSKLYYSDLAEVSYKTMSKLA